MFTQQSNWNSLVETFGGGPELSEDSIPTGAVADIIFQNFNESIMEVRGNIYTT